MVTVREHAKGDLGKRAPHTARLTEDGRTEDDATWHRAAWYGWQFVSRRDGKQWIPQTIWALEDAVPLAYRFIGVARQRANYRGTLHSDRRNYLMSTLTGL